MGTTTTIVGTGKVARRLGDRLGDRDAQVRAFAPDALMGTPVDQLAAWIKWSDAVVFAAAPGERSSALKLLAAANAARVYRYVMLSFEEDDVDRALQASDRDWTIVRPGILTDGVTRERVYISDQRLRGPVRRYDMAAVLDAVLSEPRSIGTTLYVEDGQDPVKWALVAALTRPQPPPAPRDLRLV
jgi:hypothetical protein